MILALLSAAVLAQPAWAHIEIDSGQAVTESDEGVAAATRRGDPRTVVFIIAQGIDQSGLDTQLDDSDADRSGLSPDPGPEIVTPPSGATE